MVAAGALVGLAGPRWTYGIASVLLVAGSLTALVMARGMSPSTLVARQQAA
jgi:hypothetical protein